MRENCTYGSMRGRTFPAGASRSTLHPFVPIVVNNDEQSVFLSFSQEFDVGDVSNSLKRTVAYLKEQDALHPDRPKTPSRNPVSEDLAIEKNCKTNGSATSRLVPAANREKAKEDSVRKDTNRIDTATLKKLPPEEQAKKGAELYENPETRKEGLAILRKSAKNGSPFALARLSAYQSRDRRTLLSE